MSTLECQDYTCRWKAVTESLPDFPVLKVKNIHPAAQPLKRAYENPACTDISIVRLLKVENGVAYFGTGISVEIPSGYYVRLYPRSSLHKYGWTLVNSVGIIDEDYRGEIIVALHPVSMNTPVDNLVVDTNLPLYACQLELVQKQNFDIQYVDTVSSTERGDRGFGSSNK